MEPRTPIRFAIRSADTPHGCQRMLLRGGASGLTTHDSRLPTLFRTRASSPTPPPQHAVHSQSELPDSLGQESLLPTHSRCESTPAQQPTVLQSQACEQAWIVHIAPRLDQRSTLADFPASSPKKPCAR